MIPSDILLPPLGRFSLFDPYVLCRTEPHHSPYPPFDVHLSHDNRPRLREVGLLSSLPSFLPGHPSILTTKPYIFPFEPYFNENKIFTLYSGPIDDSRLLPPPIPPSPPPTYTQNSETSLFSFSFYHCQ